MLKIITVCGLGVGSSLIMKMTVDSAMRQLGIPCDIEHWDMGTVSSKTYDLLVTTEEFYKNFQNQENVIYLKNMVSVPEAKQKLNNYFEIHGIQQKENN